MLREIRTYDIDNRERNTGQKVKKNTEKFIVR